MKNSPETLKLRREKRQHFKATVDPSSIKPFIIKICKTCGELKECAWATTFTQRGKPEYRAHCSACWRLKTNKYRDDNPAYKERKKLTQKLRTRDIKRRAVDYLGGCCKLCSYLRSMRGLTFHHRERHYKEMSIAELKQYSWEKVRKELDKCDLLCFNCHMEIEEALELEKDGLLCLLKK